MSAPKRTPSLTDTRSIPPELARWIETRQRWANRFSDNLKHDTTAEHAWEMLTNAGLKAVAHNALCFYAHPPSDRLKKEQRNLESVDRKIEALMRARKIERERRNAGDPRTGLFSDRRSRLEIDLLRAEEPFAFDGSTVGDWVIRRLIAGKRKCDLPKLRKAFASLGARCPISDRKFWLYILRCYASNAGVTLGAERLAALANCSDPHSSKSHLGPRTLARYYKLFFSQVDADCRAIRNVPPPLPLFPPQDY
jgi:hypothetical protein